MTTPAPTKNADVSIDPAADPIALFGLWLADAEKAEPRDPGAACLATVDADGRPSVRMMLVKGYDEKGFVFYTNLESRKGRELLDNSHAALCFYWKSLGRQIRIEGDVVPVSEEEADAYFASRPRGSRIGAWASRQSRPLSRRDALEDRLRKLEAEYEGSEHIPRPPHWSGFRLVPEMIEFWAEGEFRLHRRVAFCKIDEDKIWTAQPIYP